jgi:hypothetical protein
MPFIAPVATAMLTALGRALIDGLGELCQVDLNPPVSLAPFCRVIRIDRSIVSKPHSRYSAMIEIYLIDHELCHFGCTGNRQFEGLV